MILRQQRINFYVSSGHFLDDKARLRTRMLEGAQRDQDTASQALPPAAIKYFITGISMP